MYKIIRCGTYYELVIVVSPHDATSKTENVKFYRYATWQIGDHQPEQLNEINKDTAFSYFSGIADGSGYASPPDTVFPTLDDILQYIKKEKKKARRKCLRHLKQLKKC